MTYCRNLVDASAVGSHSLPHVFLGYDSFHNMRWACNLHIPPTTQHSKEHYDKRLQA